LYAGIATVALDGEDHSVPIKIVADGEKVIYQTEQGAFAFVAQRAIKDAMTSMVAPDPDSSPVESTGLKAGWTQPQVKKFQAAAAAWSFKIGKHSEVPRDRGR
jgi:hypothetical protein